MTAYSDRTIGLNHTRLVIVYIDLGSKQSNTTAKYNVILWNYEHIAYVVSQNFDMGLTYSLIHLPSDIYSTSLGPDTLRNPTWPHCLLLLYLPYFKIISE